MATCIWCRKHSDGKASSVEHVIPEAIGCPPEFVLTEGIVCAACNNGLAYLDQAVAHDFDFFTFWHGVHRKGGRLPVIDSRGNVTAFVVGRKPTMTVTGKLRPVKGQSGVAATASRVPTGRNVTAEIQRKGNIAEFNIQFLFGQDPRFVRGIYKIALSALAFYNRKGALEGRFDEVREFVRFGRGTRHILFVAATDKKYTHRIGPAIVTDKGLIWSHMRLGVLEFFVDLSEGMQLLEVLTAELQRIRPGQFFARPMPDLVA